MEVLENAFLYSARFLLPITTPLIEDGALLTCGRKIVAVGKRAELAAAYPGAAAIDFGNRILLPPMVNAHTHLELTHFPEWNATASGRPLPNSFVDWVLNLVRIKTQLDVEQIRKSLADGLAASMAAGTGAVGDILTTLPAHPAYAGFPMRGQVFCEMLGRDIQHTTRRLSELEMLPSVPAPNLVWGVSPHAPYTLSQDVFEAVVAWSVRHHQRLSMHLAETAEECRFVANQNGPIADRLYQAAGWSGPAKGEAAASPVQWALDNGRLPAGSLAVHGVHVSPEDVELVARSKLAVVLCPRSNASFGNKHAPIDAYRKAGVPLALGTDSRASAASLSVWDELAFACDWFDGLAEPEELLTMATHGGAEVLGLTGRMGSLQPNCEASFQVVSLPYTDFGGESLVGDLCRAGDQVRVDALYLGGVNVLP